MHRAYICIRYRIYDHAVIYFTMRAHSWLHRLTKSRAHFSAVADTGPTRPCMAAKMPPEVMKAVGSMPRGGDV